MVLQSGASTQQDHAMQTQQQAPNNAARLLDVCNTTSQLCELLQGLSETMQKP
jgi:hypothetical protein